MGYDEMKFTYEAYRNLIALLRECGYTICDYHNYTQADRSVIIRHDIDLQIEKAVKMAEIERDMNVSSTYFVLVCSNFFNIFSKRNQAYLREICAMGHAVGLHFDEVKYEGSHTSLVQAMEQEAALLEQCLGCEVRSLSMHRPSKATLEADYKIAGGRIVNSYSTEFFHNHKYVTDSRRNWREDVIGIIKSGEYDRLHVLTHPFWYDVKEQSAADGLKRFCTGRAEQCYDDLSDNMRNLEEFLGKEDIWQISDR